MRYLRMGAHHGDALSEEMCRLGLGDAEEYAEKIAQEMKEEADDGDIQSMISYAKMCYSGEGIELDKKEASCYYEKAAKLGESQAMFEIGKMCVNGDGIPENKKK